MTGYVTAISSAREGQVTLYGKLEGEEKRTFYLVINVDPTTIARPTLGAPITITM